MHFIEEDKKKKANKIRRKKPKSEIEFPKMVKRTPEEIQEMEEVSAFEEHYDFNSPKFDTHRQLISTAGSYRKYREADTIEPSSSNALKEDYIVRVQSAEPPELHMLRHDQPIKKKKKRKEKKPKKKKMKKRDVSEPNIGGLKRKATVIVSKRIVRQATERNQTLGEYIRQNKLKIVDPTEEDLRRVSNRPATASARKIKSANPTSSKNLVKMDLFEELKKDEYFNKMDGRVFSEHKLAKDPKFKRRGTLQSQKLRLEENKSELKRSLTVLSIPKNLKKEKNSLKPSRKMSLNDWMMFVFLCVLTLFGIILSLIEFSYYADTYCEWATEEIQPFWTYFEIIFTTLYRIGILPISYMDLRYRENSKIKILRPFLLSALNCGSVSSSNIGVNVYDYLL